MGLDLGIRCGGFAAESVFADSDATGTVATDRPVAGYPPARVVRVLACPPKRKYLTGFSFLLRSSANSAFNEGEQRGAHQPSWTGALQPPGGISWWLCFCLLEENSTGCLVRILGGISDAS